MILLMIVIQWILDMNKQEIIDILEENGYSEIKGVWRKPCVVLGVYGVAIDVLEKTVDYPDITPEFFKKLIGVSHE